MPHVLSDIVQALETHAHVGSDDLALTFLGPDGRPAGALSYGELHRRAGTVAARLVSRPDPQRPVLLLIRPEAASVAVLLGCLYAGAPCAPAPTPGRHGSLTRLAALAAASGADVAVASGDLDHVRQAAPALDWVDADAIGEGPVISPRARSDDLALIQFTSGSTRDPRGVELTHANLAANLDMLRQAFEVNDTSRFASWMPLFHDMGLSMLLMPLYFGVQGVLMSPLTFVRQPSRWMGMMHEHRATITGAPNFAFDLCVDRVAPEACAGLDLSCCNIVFCGAEPVRRQTLHRFSQRYRAHGLAPSALFPAYGLAEAVCFVSGGRLADPGEEGVGPSGPMPCGRAAAGSEIRIVDAAASRTLRQGEEGEVWIAGPHVGRGYRGSPSESMATFHAKVEESQAPHLRTGDLGYLDAVGRLVLVGRAKDVLIYRGGNIHAGDLEAAVAESHPGFSAVGAAFAIPAGAGEGIVVVQEAARGRDLLELEAMRLAALEALTAEHGLRLHDLILVRPGALPKTSSGKVRRGTAREMYLRSALPDLFKKYTAQA